MAEVVVDTKAIDQLATDINRAKRALIGRLGDRGYQLLRDEIKKTAFKTGHLLQGVAPPDVDYEKLESTLTVSARTGQTGPVSGELIGADGKPKKTVTLKPRPPFNYAESVARGRKGFTAKGAAIEAAGHAAIGPGFAHALLVPVPTVPVGEDYVLAGGQIFVFRRSVKATKPNPYDERAAKRLSDEAPNIGKAVLERFFK